MAVDVSDVVVEMNWNGFLVGPIDVVMFSYIFMIISHWPPPQLLFDSLLSAGHRQKE